jgi:hypothetical protein
VDCEADFFFMELVINVDGVLSVKTSLLAEMPETGQHVFLFLIPRVYWMRE